MTAPDPGLTDLLAAEVEKHLPEDFIRLVIAGTNTSASHQYCSCGDDPHLDWAVHVAEHVALVVEQHTNGRIKELEATVARVENALPEASTGFNPTLSEYDKGWERGQQSVAQYVRSAIAGDDLAALEGEQR